MSHGPRYLVLQVAWLRAGVLGDSGEHPRPNFLAIMECEHIVRPAWVRQGTM